MMWSSGMGWGGWLVMSLTALAVWVLVVFGMVALFRGVRGDDARRGRGARHDADQILDQRFGRGEIDAQGSRQQVLRSAH